MSIFDQFKLAQDIMKNLSPDQRQTLLQQAQEQKSLLADQIRKVVEEEIKKHNLVSREEIEKMIKEKN